MIRVPHWALSILFLVVASSASTLCGVVVDSAANRPLAGAVIAAEKGILFMADPVFGYSNLDGTFCIEHLQPGRYRIEVMASGFEMKRFHLEVAEGAGASIRCPLERAVGVVSSRHDPNGLPPMLVGTIRDSLFGTPVEAAGVTLLQTGETTVTDAGGGFGFVLSPGDYLLELAHAGYVSDTIAESFETTGEVRAREYVLRPRILPQDTCGFLAGQVVDSSQKSIAGVTISVIETKGNERIVAITDSSGTYRSEYLAPGSYTVLAKARGYKSSISENIRINKGDTAFHEIQLEFLSDQVALGSNNIIGKVAIVDTSAPIPAAGADVWLYGGTREQDMTDSLGYFRFEAIPNGLYSVRVASPGYDTVLAERILLFDSKRDTLIELSLRRSQQSEDGSGSTPGTTGVIHGIVTDRKNRVPVAGAVIRVSGMDVESVSDIEGRYRFAGIRPGTYAVVGTHPEYGELRREGVKLAARDSLVVDIPLSRSKEVSLPKLYVTAQAVKNTQASLLHTRKEAFTISDVLASDQISRSASSSAAEAVQLVTGITIEDGRYVIVRGLSDRYDIVRLNGIELPSSHPDKRAVALDVFPSGLLENLTVIKTFTPDVPAHFAGGIVDIATKSFPDKLTFTLSGGTGMNTASTFRDGYLTTERGEWDWLGIDDGTRAMPDEFDTDPVWAPLRYSWLVNRDSADILVARSDELAKAFDTSYDPDTARARPDLKLSMSLGNTVRFLDRPLGLFVSFTYSNGERAKYGSREQNWSLLGEYDLNDSLSSSQGFSVSESSHDVLWGFLANASYELIPDHEVSFLYLHTQSGEEEVSNKASYHYVGMIGDNKYQFREISYLQRSLDFYLANGQHEFGLLNGSKIDWKAGYSKVRHDEPDNRVFSNTIEYETQVSAGDTVVDTAYYIRQNFGGVVPTRMYRTVLEPRFEGGVDITVPFMQWGDLQGFFRIGGLWQQSRRDFSQRVLRVNLGSESRMLDDFNGNVDLWSADENMGLIGIDTSSSGRLNYKVGNMALWDAAGDSLATHMATQEVGAVYFMADLPVLAWLSLNGGVRGERIRMHIENLIAQEGNLREHYWLPAAGLIFHLGSDMKVRLNYGKTRTRPIFREKAPYPNENYALGLIESGNPDLKTTSIDNYDLRWEWFTGPGEVLTAGLFVKVLHDPIEKSFVLGTSNGEMTWQNVPHAQVIGIEAEVQKKLDFIANAFRDFSMGLNFTKLWTEMDFDSAALITRGDMDKTHPVVGAADFIVNSNFQYSNEDLGLSAAVFFWLIGPRIAFIPSEGTPPAVDFARSNLNCTVEKKIIPRLSVKVTGKNLLNQEYRAGHEFKGARYYRNRYTKGAGVSLSVKLQF